MYAGIRACKAMNVNTILNSILNLIGSQCKDLMTGEAWDHLIEDVLLKQVNRELQYSNVSMIISHLAILKHSEA